jgi:protein-disulfide isomerase
MPAKTLLISVLLAALSTPQSTKPPEASDAKTPSAEIGITKEQAAKIVEELQMIRMMLQQDLDSRAKNSVNAPTDGKGPADVSSQKTLTGLGKHVLGRDSAPITLVEFVDLECPFCIQFHNDVFPEVRRKYIETGQLRFVIFNFPLPSHPYSDPAAKLSLCAGLQGKYWDVLDVFLSGPHIATPDEAVKLANDARLDRKELDQCLNNDATAQGLKREEDVARTFGVYGTPTFLLGRSQGDGVTGRIIDGAPTLAALEKMIQEVLADQSFSVQPLPSSESSTQKAP